MIDGPWHITDSIWVIWISWQLHSVYMGVAQAAASWVEHRMELSEPTFLQNNLHKTEKASLCILKNQGWGSWWKLHWSSSKASPGTGIFWMTCCLYAYECFGGGVQHIVIPPPLFKAKSDLRSPFIVFFSLQLVFPQSSVWIVNLPLHMFVIPAIHINL